MNKAQPFAVKWPAIAARPRKTAVTAERPSAIIDATSACSFDQTHSRLTGKEFEQIRHLAYNKFGLDLKSGKEELVSARLGKLIRRGGFRSFSAYFEHVNSDATGNAMIEMIDALTTNHTSFFREPSHFDFLKAALQDEFRSTPVLRIWSAACSTGEEPYSIALCLSEAGRPPSAFQIVATDISTRALAKAKAAIYPGERFSQLTDAWKKRCLIPCTGEQRGSWSMRPEVMSSIRFRRLNLIEPFPPEPPFHVIFCRNVMIYFDRQTQTGLVNRLATRLEPGGYLFVGHSESLNAIQHSLNYCMPAIYRKGTPQKRARV